MREVQVNAVVKLYFEGYTLEQALHMVKEEFKKEELQKLVTNYESRRLNVQ